MPNYPQNTHQSSQFQGSQHRKLGDFAPGHVFDLFNGHIDFVSKLVYTTHISFLTIREVLVTPFERVVFLVNF